MLTPNPRAATVYEGPREAGEAWDRWTAARFRTEGPKMYRPDIRPAAGPSGWCVGVEDIHQGQWRPIGWVSESGRPG